MGDIITGLQQEDGPQMDINARGLEY